MDDKCPRFNTIHAAPRRASNSDKRTSAQGKALGRPRTVNYTLEQAEAIIRLWHEKPKRTPLQIVGLAKTLLGLPEDHDMRASWVRDLVIKYVGTAKRDKPEGWAGIKDE